jgi:hypothetical protein
MTGYVDTRIQLRAAMSSAYEGDCPLLLSFAPGPEYLLFPKQWNCGPATFDYLVDSLLESHGMDPEERDALLKRVMDGKAALLYRGITIERDETVPENRLWPF